MMTRPTTNTAVRIAALSLGVGAAVLALKSFAAAATGSIALFSDALESIVNVATAVATLVAVRLAARPASASLPYGYHKAEYFSAVLIGIFIAVAALVIFQQAWTGFVAPRPFDADPIGIGVSVLATGPGVKGPSGHRFRSRRVASRRALPRCVRLRKAFCGFWCGPRRSCHLCATP